MGDTVDLVFGVEGVGIRLRQGSLVLVSLQGRTSLPDFFRPMLLGVDARLDDDFSSIIGVFGRSNRDQERRNNLGFFVNWPKEPTLSKLDIIMSIYFMFIVIAAS